MNKNSWLTWLTWLNKHINLLNKPISLVFCHYSRSQILANISQHWPISQNSQLAKFFLYGTFEKSAAKSGNSGSLFVFLGVLFE